MKILKRHVNKKEIGKWGKLDPFDSAPKLSRINFRRLISAVRGGWGGSKVVVMVAEFHNLPALQVLHNH